MGLKKGQTNNPDGRPKGTPNKITQELREALRHILSNEIEKIPELLDKLLPKQRLEIVLKLAPFVIPREGIIKLEDPDQLRVIDFVNVSKQFPDYSEYSNEELEEKLNMFVKVARFKEEQ